MIKATDIITASFSNVADLLGKNYLCVSITGKVYGEYDRKEDIKRIVNLNTFRFYYHAKAKDYYACNFLYRDILERKGMEKLKAELNQLLIKHNKDKIALCGYGLDGEFCYRHILSNFLNENGISVSEFTKVDLSKQKEYWRRDVYKLQGHNNLKDEYVSEVLEKVDWIYAKTMPQTPHHYVLRKDFGDNSLFLNIVSHIRFYGKPEIFEGVLYRVFCHGAYKYWDHPCDALNEDVDLINRKLYKI